MKYFDLFLIHLLLYFVQCKIYQQMYKLARDFDTQIFR